MADTSEKRKSSVERREEPKEDKPELAIGPIGTGDAVQVRPIREEPHSDREPLVIEKVVVPDSASRR